MDSTTKIITNLIGNSSEANNSTMVSPSFLIGSEYYTAYNTYLYIMIVLGVVGNLIVLLVFLNNRPSTTTDWFIFSITVCDFISSSVNVPVFVTFTNGYWQMYGTTLICRFQMFLNQSTVLSSSFLICGLALDRYLKVRRCILSFTTARARNVCLLITVITTVLSTPAFAMYENRAGRCEAIIMNKTFFLYYLMVLVIFIFATTVVVFSYIKVTEAVIDSETNFARHFRNNDRNVRNQRFCCCIRYNRTNRVEPSTTIVYQNMVFRSTLPQASSSRNIQEDRKECGQSLRFPETIQMPQSGASDNQMRQRKLASLQTTKISFLVCSIFILSWITPWLCFVFASIPGMKNNVHVLRFMLFGKMTYLINGFANPIIYTLLNKKFRSYLRDIFCSCKNRLMRQV